MVRNLVCCDLKFLVIYIYSDIAVRKEKDIFSNWKRNILLNVLTLPSTSFKQVSRLINTGLGPASQPLIYTLNCSTTHMTNLKLIRLIPTERCRKATFFHVFNFYIFPTYCPVLHRIFLSLKFI